MKNLKLITVLLLLASMILSVTACTTAEESKAETSGEVSSETSDDTSEVNDNNNENNEDKIKLYNDNHALVTLDRHKGDKELYFIELITDAEVITSDFITKFDYNPKDVLSPSTPTDSEFEKLSNDVKTLLPNYKQKMLDDFTSKYEFDDGDIFLDDEYLFCFDDFVAWQFTDNLYNYYIYVLAYLDEAEKDAISKTADVIEFDTEFTKNPDGKYYIQYRFPLPE